MESIWVRTEKLPTGSDYRTILTVGQDVAIPLIGDAAIRYAHAVIKMATRAAHDAAIYNQWVHGRKVEPQVPAMLIHKDLVPDRPEIAEGDIPAPLAMAPKVVVDSTGRARGIVAFTAPAVVADTAWEFEEAMQHALGALSAWEVSELDSAYAALLTGRCDISPRVAESVIGELSLWMPVSGEPDPTSKRLARDLHEASAPAELVNTALEGGYDENLADGQQAPPLLRLHADLLAAGRADLAARVVDGEWDSSRAEDDAWDRSPQGQAMWKGLFDSVAEQAEQQRQRQYPVARAARRPKKKRKR